MPDQRKRLANACSMLLQAACQSAESGDTRTYFEKWRDGEKGEAKRRQQFAHLREALRTDSAGSLEQGVLLFKKLNSEYGTRFDLKHVESAGATVISMIPDAAWQSRLFNLAEDQAVAIASSIPEIVARIRNDAGKGPYSLTTKFLHFLFPELFVIYDSQAATSIWMWSLFAIGHDQPGAQVFEAARLSKSNGTGYCNMIRFYHRLWHYCTEDVQHTAIQAAASLEEFLNEENSRGHASVTVLDVIDKHLWRCNGNPIRLGLASEP